MNHEPKLPNPITITITVDAGAAVLCGESTAGPHKLVLSRDDLAKMSETERTWLANHLSSAPSNCEIAWGDPLTRHADPVGRADLQTLISLLYLRAGRIAVAVESNNLARADRAEKAAAEAKRCREWKALARTQPAEWFIDSAGELRNCFSIDGEIGDILHRHYGSHQSLAFIADRLYEVEAIAATMRETLAQAKRDALVTVILALECEPSRRETLAALADLVREGRAMAKDVDFAVQCHAHALIKAIDPDFRCADMFGASIDDTMMISAAVELRRRELLKVAQALPESMHAEVHTGLAWIHSPSREGADGDGDVQAGVVGLWCTFGDLCVAVVEEISAIDGDE